MTWVTHHLWIGGGLKVDVDSKLVAFIETNMIHSYDQIY